MKVFLKSIPYWIKGKLFVRKLIKKALLEISDFDGPILFPEHHLSHAASAFYPSPYDNAAILTCDGVGEWTTTSICHGIQKDIRIIKEMRFPHSLGLLYSSFTYFCGFKVNSGEYKLMGLAPYGDPLSDETLSFKRKIYDQLIDLREDGSFILNMKYFSFVTQFSMTNDIAWENLFGLQRRDQESEFNQSYMNLALAIQEVTEEIMIKLVRTAKDLTGSDYLVLAGGVALNCVCNGKILRSKIFRDIWIQPAAGDAGGALGAAMAVWHISGKSARFVNGNSDGMRGSYLGSKVNDIEVEEVANRYDAHFIKKEARDELLEEVIDRIEEGDVIGWIQGRMEFGPRALCNRSIIGDPRKSDMQKKLNLKIKYRESFRPFAPVTLEEEVSEYFCHEKSSPYMLLVAPVNDQIRNKEPKSYNNLPMKERLYHERSSLPAITHVDYSARLQTINQSTNRIFHDLLMLFQKRTSCSVLVNTSFNVRGEPIVCSADDAYRCFMRTEMDILVVGNYIFYKQDQPNWEESDNWKVNFTLD